ncbi:MAG TPA: antitoxin Xre/MbcA/ParS toxin-binding domain-containing protein [Tangfeifania sp.]|nr:antitoxin Xre/MbcA/ParS toxin-binding domain-containing protein [Tangfeifania sp.]
MENSAQKLNYDAVDDRDIFLLIKKSRAGMKYSTFQKISKYIPLKPGEWSKVLHLSERTLQRYKKEKLSFAPLYSEKIIELQLLFNKGTEVFGDRDKFYKWLNSKNIALGGIPPVSLLDNTFGIMMIKDEITRIEHGILA